MVNIWFLFINNILKKLFNSRKFFMTVTTSALFNSVPDDKFHLFNKGGEPDGKKVVDFFKFTKEDVSVAANIPLTSVRYDKKMTEEFRERLVKWAIAINLVGSYFNDLNKTKLWFQAPNPVFGGISPREMIRLGRFKKVLRFIQTALDENNARIR